MVGQQSDNGSRRPFGASTLRRALYDVERRAKNWRGNDPQPVRRSRAGWVVPAQRNDSGEGQVDDDEGFEAFGLPPDYGLPPAQIGRNVVGPRVPSGTGIRNRITSALGTRNRRLARRDTPRQIDSTYEQAIRGLGGRQDADPFGDMGMGGALLADIPLGSGLFRGQQQSNRIRKRTGQVGDRRRAEELERQFQGARPTPGGLVHRAGSRRGPYRPRAAAIPPGLEQSLWSNIRDGYPEDAVRYYLEQLTQQDAPGPSEPNSLGEILKDDAISLQEGQPRQTWTAKRTLGSGGFGDVILWQRQRGAGQTIDRLAVKNATFDPFFRDYSSEAHLTRRVNVAGCKNVVKVYDWAALEREQRVRIIYEFCPLGDLVRTLDFYGAHRLVFPEPFLWHVFYNIATAICYCARGTTAAEPRNGWEEIVHCDLKPDNVLMALPDTEVNRFYPTMKLADFGLAYTIPNETIRHFKSQYGAGGTPGYMAPEMDPTIRKNPQLVTYPFPGSHSDVHSLGLMMQEFTRLATPRYPPYAVSLLEDGLQEGWGWEYWPYSEDLTLLIHHCTQRDARNRPTAYDLYRRTKEKSEGMAELLETLDRHAQTEHTNRYFTTGTVLYTREQQEEFKQYDGFRNAYIRATDWFHRHEEQFADLCDAAVNPRPAPPGYIAIGNGLKFARIPNYPNPQGRYGGEQGPRESQPTRNEYGQGLQENIRLGGAALKGGPRGSGLTGKMRSFVHRFRRTGN
ncbi:MAG: hypothetical protein M1830_000120 [Pleopsidium flavum]|nr:MAG: hypothetical protein M1830_000120 [Pleopsidium flavum]